MEEKDLAQIIEVAKTAALIMAALVGAGVGAWRSIKTQLANQFKPIHQELEIQPGSPTQLPHVVLDEPTLKSTVLQIESKQSVMAAKLEEIKDRQETDSKANDRSNEQISEQVKHMGRQMNNMQEQLNTVSENLAKIQWSLMNGTSHGKGPKLE